MRTVPLRVKPDKIRLLGFLPGGEVPFIPSAVVVRRHLQQDGDEGVDHNGIFGAPPTPQFESVVGVTNPPKSARKPEKASAKDCSASAARLEGKTGGTDENAIGAS